MVTLIGEPEPLCTISREPIGTQSPTVTVGEIAVSTVPVTTVVWGTRSAMSSPSVGCCYASVLQRQRRARWGDGTVNSDGTGIVPGRGDHLTEHDPGDCGGEQV